MTDGIKIGKPESMGIFFLNHVEGVDISGRQISP
jgi:hypothetical protein